MIAAGLREAMPTIESGMHVLIAMTATGLREAMLTIESGMHDPIAMIATGLREAMPTSADIGTTGVREAMDHVTKERVGATAVTLATVEVHGARYPAHLQRHVGR